MLTQLYIMISFKKMVTCGMIGFVIGIPFLIGLGLLIAAFG